MSDQSAEALLDALRRRIGPALQSASAAQSALASDPSSHPPDDLIKAYQQGWVSGPLRDDLRLHLVGCALCRSHFAALHLAPTETLPALSEGAMSASHQDDPAPVSAVSVELPPAIATPDITSAQSESLSLAQGSSGASRRWWGASISAGVLALMVWSFLPMGPPIEPITPRPPIFSGLKGQRPQWTKGIEQSYADFATRALLHLGVADGLGMPVRRLHRDLFCRPQQSLFFGFSLARPGGYVYLFRVDPVGRSAPELLYPFAAAKPIYLAGGTVHIVQRGEITQRYPLAQEEGEVLFVLLQRKKPLLSKQIDALLGQKKGWGERLSSLQRAGLSLQGSSDRFLVRLRRAKPGVTP